MELASIPFVPLPQKLLPCLCCHLPAGHAVHPDWFSEGWYIPDGQFTQTTEPEYLWYVPAAQATQNFSSPDANLPGGHTLHLLLNPDAVVECPSKTSAENLPSGQRELPARWAFCA